MEDDFLLCPSTRPYRYPRVYPTYPASHRLHLNLYTTHCWLTMEGLASCTLRSSLSFRLTNTGWMAVPTFKLSLLSRRFTMFAELWSLNGWLFPGRIGIWKRWLLWRGENRRKSVEAAMRANNKHNPQMAPTPGIEPEPHWWEESALTTTPSLLRNWDLQVVGIPN